MKKGQNDFMKLVHGTEDVGNDIGSGFRKMIKDMNDRLGITGNNKNNRVNSFKVRNKYLKYSEAL